MLKIVFHFFSLFGYALCLISFLSGCNKYYLSATYQKVGRNDLASTHVGSPDPRQQDPPIGQMLVMDWFIPKSILDQHPSIVLHMIFRDHSQETKIYPMQTKIGYVTYRLINKKFEEKKGFLTYRVEIVTHQGTVYKEWKHQLWTELIELKEDSYGR